MEKNSRQYLYKDASRKILLVYIIIDLLILLVCGGVSFFSFNKENLPLSYVFIVAFGLIFLLTIFLSIKNLIFNLKFNKFECNRQYEKCLLLAQKFEKVSFGKQKENYRSLQAYCNMFLNNIKEMKTLMDTINYRVNEERLSFIYCLLEIEKNNLRKAYEYLDIFRKVSETKSLSLGNKKILLLSSLIGLKEGNEITLEVEEVIDFFQIPIVEKILNQKRKH